MLLLSKKLGDPYRIRTDVNGVRGRCLNHLTNGPSSGRNPLHSVPALRREPRSAPLPLLFNKNLRIFVELWDAGDGRRRNSLHSVPASSLAASGENSISAPSFSSFLKNLRIFEELRTGDEGRRIRGRETLRALSSEPAVPPWIQPVQNWCTFTDSNRGPTD